MPLWEPTLVVIGGGGLQQLEAATGVLQALEEVGVCPDLYRGSSAGAVIAALHGSGICADEIEIIIRATPVEKLFKRCNPLKHLWYTLTGGKLDHLYDNTGMRKLLEQYVTEKARKRVRVTATRVRDYLSIMCDCTPATTAISASIQQVFKPGKIGDDWYGDGGLKNMVPTPAIYEISNYEHIYIILAPEETEVYSPVTRLGRAIMDLYHTMDRETTQIYEDGWDKLPNVTVIRPVVTCGGLLEWSDNFDAITQAKESALAILKEKGIKA